MSRPCFEVPISHSDNSSCAPYKVYNIGNHQPVDLMTFIKTIEAALFLEALQAADEATRMLIKVVGNIRQHASAHSPRGKRMAARNSNPRSSIANVAPENPNPVGWVSGLPRNPTTQVKSRSYIEAAHVA